MRLSLKLKTEDVQLEREDGSDWALQVREMRGEDRDDYLNYLKRRTGYGGKQIKDFKGLQAQLLCRCLYDINQNELVSYSEIMTFPASVQSALFNVAQRLSGLGDQKSEDEGENEDEELG